MLSAPCRLVWSLKPGTGWGPRLKRDTEGTSVRWDSCLAVPAGGRQRQPRPWASLALNPGIAKAKVGVGNASAYNASGSQTTD